MGGCLVPGAEVAVGLLSLVEATGLLSFLEKIGLQGELRSRLLFEGECVGDLGTNSGAGSISLSSQASIFCVCGGGSPRVGSQGVMI